MCAVRVGPSCIKPSAGTNASFVRKHVLNTLFLSSGPVAVEVDQAAGLDDLALVLSHILNVEVDLLCPAILDDIALDIRSPSRAARMPGT